MGRRAVASCVLAVLLVTAPFVPAMLSGPEEPARLNSGASVDSLASRLGVADERSTSTVDPVDHEVEVIVELKRGATVPRDEFPVERILDREGARHLQGSIPLTRIRELSRDPRIEAIRIQNRRVGVDGRTADGVAAIGADDLHARGITGENVTVGVIDRDFRPSDPEIAGNVGAYRSFESADGEWVHGTAVASVVADTAPNATLHLAAVGPSTSPAEYREAVDWLRASGADVVVDAGSYFGQPGDGDGEIARIAANASEDVVFVTAAGNYARRHWNGTHAATGDREWVTFGEDEGNVLGEGPVDGRIGVELQWAEWPTGTDYDLYLMEARTGEDRVVAHSKARQDGDDDPTERIDVTVQEGRYYVAVRAHNATGTHHLELYATHPLAVSTANGSLTTPGNAPGVLTVGSYGDGGVKEFSSRGLARGRPGVDLVAPDSVAASAVEDGEGTSYAAPYAAGTVALLASRYPDLTPDQLRAIVRSSAVDVGRRGPDVASGYGLVDARAAHRLAVERDRYAPINDSGV